MNKIVEFEVHAWIRLLQRASLYGLTYVDARNRVIETVKLGKESKRKHLARHGGNKTYHKYFADNLSFYVICKEKVFRENREYWIKTVIIEEGRE